MNRSTLPSILAAVALAACGPAAEDRNVMHARAKVFQDSIANEIRNRMNEAEAPVNTGVRLDTVIRPGAPAQPSPAPQNAGR